ncbi:hypothetical protein Tco_0981534 [Tanacetum coccineum]
MPPVITCASALNPCFNVNVVELLIESISIDLECFDDDFATKAKEQFNKSLEDFKEAILDEEVLANETLPLSDEEIAIDEVAFEARSNRSGDEIEITFD